MTTSADPDRADGPTAPQADGTTATPDAPPKQDSGVRDKIDAEHRALRAVLDRVAAAGDLSHLLTAVADLRALLVPHFATEEADEGFEALLGRRAPHLLDDLAHVIDEHAEILADVDRLTGRACACLEGPVAEVRREAAALVARLHAHEEKETELLVGAVYTDLGSAS